jgi:hypothetical protein
MNYDEILDEKLLHLECRRIIEKATEINDFVGTTLSDENYFTVRLQKTFRKTA